MTGRLRAGLAADFVVLDSDPFALGPDALLGARVRRTVAGGVDHQVRPSTPSADLQ